MAEFLVYLVIDTTGDSWAHTDRDTAIEMALDEHASHPLRVICLAVEAEEPEEETTVHVDATKAGEDIAAPSVKAA